MAIPTHDTINVINPCSSNTITISKSFINFIISIKGFWFEFSHLKTDALCCSSMLPKKPATNKKQGSVYVVASPLVFSGLFCSFDGLMVTRLSDDMLTALGGQPDGQKRDGAGQV